MNSYELSRAWFDFSFENADKIKPNHTALYFFCIEHCNRLGWVKKFGLPTEMAKYAIGIHSYNTYINTLNDLVDWGFIEMIQKSKNQFSSNIVAISNFNKALDKALDKAIVKHVIKQDTKQGESNSESDSSINKPITIEPNNQEPQTKNIDSVKKTVHPSYGFIKECFLGYYLEQKKDSYYFKPIDGKKINSIIEQLKFKISEKNTREKITLEDDKFPEQINLGFEYLLGNINDQWIKDNLSLSIIDSKFNEIISKIINNGKDGKPKRLVDEAGERLRNNQYN